jgi:hypothetical protein
MRTIGIALLAATLVGVTASVADEPVAKSDAAAAKPKSPSCSAFGDFQGWRAAPDAKSIYIRVDRKRVLQLQLATACPTLTWPDARLITVWRGTRDLCDALDWDLKVSMGPPVGMPIPCLVKKVVQLTPEEMAALPKKQLP